MTAYNAEADRLIERMQRWEDHAERDGTCVKCGDPVGGNEPEHEPSPLCNLCAQDLATRTFPDQLEAARAEIASISAHRDRLEAMARLAADQRDIARAEIERLEAHSGILEFQRDSFHDALTAARARIADLEGAVERMAPVVAVTEEWRDRLYPRLRAIDDGVRICDSPLLRAVDAYRKAKP